MTEGYIKFNCIRTPGETSLPEEKYGQLESARAQLYGLGLIGIYPDGIGFGNISVRKDHNKSFFISGSATGGKETLSPSDYALVTDYSLMQNTIFCTGIINASSESLTHAAIYQSVPQAGAVIHIHCLRLWEKLLYKLPTTSHDIEYGTPEMAKAVGELAIHLNNKEEKIIVMGGHREGILSFGQDLIKATQQIITVYERYNHP